MTALIPTAVTLIALQFLPDKVPAHYDFNMNITRWGSKYENLLICPVPLFMSAFMYAMAHYASKQENGESNRKVMLISGVIINLFFTAMTVGSLALDFRAVEGEEINGDVLMKIIFIAVSPFTASPLTALKSRTSDHAVIAVKNKLIIIPLMSMTF